MRKTVFCSLCSLHASCAIAGLGDVTKGKYASWSTDQTTKFARFHTHVATVEWSLYTHVLIPQHLVHRRPEREKQE